MSNFANYADDNTTHAEKNDMNELIKKNCNKFFCIPIFHVLSPYMAFLF